jgi:hypothetical protein
MPYYVISYVPLLYGDGEALHLVGNNIQAGLEDMVRKVYEAPSDIEACVWLQTEDAPVVVLVLDEAQAIYDHIMYWTEGKPEEWFNLFLDHEDGGYGLRLFPKIDKTVSRFRIKMLDQYETIIGKDEVQIIFCPLTFWSKTTETFDRIKDSLKGEIEVYLLDAQEIIDQELPPLEELQQKTLSVGKMTINNEWGKFAHVSAGQVP